MPGDGGACGGTCVTPTDREEKQVSLHQLQERPSAAVWYAGDSAHVCQGVTCTESACESVCSRVMGCEA